MSQTGLTIPDIIKYADDLVKWREYSPQVHITLGIIRTMCESPTEQANMDDTIKQELVRVKQALWELLVKLENQETIEMDIYGIKCTITFLKWNGGRKLYRFCHNGFEAEIGIAKRRALIYILQQHPRPMIYSDYADKWVYPIILGLKEEGFLQILIEEQGKIRFRKPEEQSKALKDTRWETDTPKWAVWGTSKASAEKHREVAQSSQHLEIHVETQVYVMKKTYTADTYEISKQWRTSHISVKIQESVVQYLRDFLKKKHTTLNPHFQRELGKIWLKIVRRDETLTLEMTPDSPLAKLN